MKKDNEENKNYLTNQIWVKKGHRMFSYFQEMTQRNFIKQDTLKSKIFSTKLVITS